jgi:hypothetical protein
VELTKFTVGGVSHFLSELGDGPKSKGGGGIELGLKRLLKRVAQKAADNAVKETCEEFGINLPNVSSTVKKNEYPRKTDKIQQNSHVISFPEK